MNELSDITMNCNAGDLLIFPSDLVHCVKAHTEETSRISVSFNMFLPKIKAYTIS